MLGVGKYSVSASTAFRLASLALQSEPRLLCHEQTDPARVERLRRELLQSGLQRTPVTLFARSLHAASPLYVADGHHRLAALSLLGASRIAAHVYALDLGTPQILPAHRIIRSAPAGWLDQIRQALHARLPLQSHGPLALCWPGGEERFAPRGAADTLRLLWQISPLHHPDFEWSITGDDAAARAELDQGALAAILVPAVTLAEVMAAADSGRLLPPRCTNFQPKPQENSIAFPLASETAASANVAMPL